MLPANFDTNMPEKLPFKEPVQGTTITFTKDSPGLELIHKVQNHCCNVIHVPEWHKLKEHVAVIEELNRDYFQDLQLLQEQLGNLYHSQLAYHQDYTCLECNDLTGDPKEVCPALNKLKVFAPFATCTASASIPQSTTSGTPSSTSEPKRNEQLGSGEHGSSKE